MNRYHAEALCLADVARVGSVTTCYACSKRIDGLPRAAGDQMPHYAADGFAYHKSCLPPDPAVTERDRALLKLKLASPMRAPAGHVIRDQADAGHLPLFVAGNEPRLI